MPKLKHGRITYFDNYDMDEYEKLARECLSIDGSVTPDELDVRDVAYEYAQEDWEELETKIDNLLEGDNLIISGSVGRWNGTNRGYETYPNWQKFIQDFGKDCDYFKVYTNNGHLYVKCSHHDGNNFCEVKRLTQRGLRRFGSWDCRKNKRTADLDWVQMGSSLFNDANYAVLIKLDQ